MPHRCDHPVSNRCPWASQATSQNWRKRKDLNLRILFGTLVFETSAMSRALPRFQNLAGGIGIEPMGRLPDHGLANRCIAALPTPPRKVHTEAACLAVRVVVLSAPGNPSPGNRHLWMAA